MSPSLFPQTAIPPSSQQIHGISQSMVSGCPIIDTILPTLTRHIGQRPIIGHGIGFDLEILHASCRRAHLISPWDHHPNIDTLRLARLYGQSPVNSLERLRHHFNIPEERAHRAMGDVLVNIQVFHHLTRSFTTLEAVYEALSHPIEMKVMPLGPHKGRPLKEIPIDYLRWACKKDFDQDLLFSLRQEIKRRDQGRSFNQACNPFMGLN